MSYLEFVIPEHVLWIHVVQLSHRMQGDLAVTEHSIADSKRADWAWVE